LLHSPEQVDALFAQMEIVHLHELDELGSSLRGPKHWHCFDLIARKPSR